MKNSPVKLENLVFSPEAYIDSTLSGRLETLLVVGKQYFVANRDCEIYFIVGPMTFIGLCEMEIIGSEFDLARDNEVEEMVDSLLFKDSKNNYWVVTPEITINNKYVDGKNFPRIVITLEGECWGKNLNKTKSIQSEVKVKLRRS